MEKENGADEDPIKPCVRMVSSEVLEKPGVITSPVGETMSILGRTLAIKVLEVVMSPRTVRRD